MVSLLKAFFGYNILELEEKRIWVFILNKYYYFKCIKLEINYNRKIRNTELGLLSYKGKK